MAQESSEPEVRHVFLQPPFNWDEMSEEEQEATADKMAEEIMRQLGEIP